MTTLEETIHGQDQDSLQVDQKYDHNKRDKQAGKSTKQKTKSLPKQSKVEIKVDEKTKRLFAAADLPLESFAGFADGKPALVRQITKTNGDPIVVIQTLDRITAAGVKLTTIGMTRSQVAAVHAQLSIFLDENQ